MSELLTPPPSIPAQLSPTAVRWTRGDCASLERAGVLNYRYELVEGVINKMGQNLGHAHMVRLLVGWLVSVFGVDFFFTQSTIDVSVEDIPTSAPEPDAIVLNHPAGELKTLPGPADIRLVIEASDTTLSYDLTTKASLYARAGIGEYWVLSLPERKLYVHRQPESGLYQNVTIVGEAESVAPIGRDDAKVIVSKLLPLREQ